MAFTENWSDILAAQVDADSPINETLMQSIRSDLIHIKEALGQNYVLAPDHDHDGVNSAKASGFEDFAAGDILQHTHDIELTTIASVYTKEKSIRITRGGTLRIKFDLRQIGTGTTYGKIYRNGVAVGTERTSTIVSYTTYFEDISGWSQGDTLELWVYEAGGAPGPSDHRNLRLYSATATEIIQEL